MAGGVTYLRPSADVSIQHTLYPTDSAAAYILINEAEPDEASTLLEHIFVAGDTSTYAKSSSFKFSCTDALHPNSKIISAKLYIRHGNDSVSSTDATLTNYRVGATVNIDSDVSKTYALEDSLMFDSLNYTTNYTDITDIAKNKPVSANFTITLTQLCDNCEVYTTTGANYSEKEYTEAGRAITTAWVEVEYTTDIGVHRKINGEWKAATAAYRKVNGAWSEISEEECKTVLSSNLIKKA